MKKLVILPNSSMCRRANQSADNGPDCGRSKRNPSGIAIVMDVADDMMPRRRRRAMRTMPSVMRRGNGRTSCQNHPSHENRECLDDLVHVTPTFPDFLSLQRARNPHRQNLTKLLNRRAHRPCRPLPNRTSSLPTVSFSVDPLCPQKAAPDYGRGWSKRVGNSTTLSF